MVYFYILYDKSLASKFIFFYMPCSHHVIVFPHMKAPVSRETLLSIFPAKFNVSLTKVPFTRSYLLFAVHIQFYFYREPWEPNVLLGYWRHQDRHIFRLVFPLKTRTLLEDKNFSFFGNIMSSLPNNENVVFGS